MASIRLVIGLSIVASASCGKDVEPQAPSPPLAPENRAPPPPPQPPAPRAAVVADTCSATWPSYWQDPAPAFAAMWTGQKISDAPAPGWSGPVFRLSDRFPRTPQDDRGAQPWRDPKFDALFVPGTSMSQRAELADRYIWAVMRYIQEGNVGNGDLADDWTLCNNKVRNWYHIPFQTYDALSGREFVHGLTREAPVTFSMKSSAVPSKPSTFKSSMWAVGFYNPTAAYALGSVWQSDGRAKPPAANLSFGEGAVIGKLLFNTLTPTALPFLANMPAWQANVSATSFCSCKAAKGATCTMIEESVQCPRSLTTAPDGKVRLMQFDVAIKDHRAPGTQWVFGTFVADGQRKAGEPNPWLRISPLGLMWGNDPPPEGVVAAASPSNPRTNGFKSEVIFWDTVDMLNASGGLAAQSPGHLGCNSRLNGPADNASSSCMSCHMTASVLDANNATPPIMAQFASPGITHECVTPSSNPATGTDAGGASASVVNDVSFSAMDQIYFADTGASQSVNMTAATTKGPVNVLGAGVPTYADGHAGWVSLDFSLQLSISLVQWTEWQGDQAQEPGTPRVFASRLPAR